MTEGDAIRAAWDDFAAANRITTASRIIDAMGGTNAVADLFEVGPSAVSNWRALGFPARLHLRVFKECQRRGLKLPDNFFEQNAA